MMNPKADWTVTRSFFAVNERLTRFGFKPMERLGPTAYYEIRFWDESEGTSYRFQIPASTNSSGETEVRLSEAGFCGCGEIPAHIRRKAEQMLQEIAEALEDTLICPQSGKPLDDVANGSMVLNVEDMKQLGKEMSSMRTNSDLQKSGMVPDPAQ